MKEFTKILDDCNENRLRVKLTLLKGKIKNVVVQHEAYVHNKWYVIVRYDCSHGFIHRDILHPDGTKEKYPILLDTLEQFLQYAEQDIKDRWEWYRSRFEKELKK
jgi:ElaB/YqjD/DUF883 family membrane-anchored ribosome-binding protein